MKQAISAAVGILALLAGSYAQLILELSPSFSFQGSSVRTETGTTESTTILTRYDLAIDTTRMLEASYYEGTIDGERITVSSIESINDDTTYTVINGVCSTDATSPISNRIRYSDDVWLIFASATEGPSGTYTVSVSPTIEKLVTVNGLPTEYNVYINAGVVSVSNEITITSFTNSAPPFSTFELPTACNQFTCNSCYRSPGPQLSPSFAFQGTAVESRTGYPTNTLTRYDLAIDVSRGLQISNFEGTSGGTTGSEVILVSVNDTIVHGVFNGVCNTSSVSSAVSFNYQPDFWGRFDNAVESPPGTFTTTDSSSALTLVTVDGIPTSYSSSSTGYSFVLTITSYTNSAPPFSTFTLPEACENYTCNSCYSSGAVARGSLLLLIIAIALLFSAM